MNWKTVTLMLMLYAWGLTVEPFGWVLMSFGSLMVADLVVTVFFTEPRSKDVDNSKNNEVK